MLDRRFLKAFLVVLAIIVAATIIPGMPVMADSGDDDIEQLRTELNATKKELADAEKDRDEYADRLEDQTLILIIVLILRFISWMLCFMTNRRQQIALLEVRKQAGLINAEQRQKRRERRKG